MERDAIAKSASLDRTSEKANIVAEKLVTNLPFKHTTEYVKKSHVH